MDTLHGPLADGVLTFVLSDVEASVRRWEAAPAAMRAAMRRHDEIMRREMSGPGCHIFRTAGDSFFSAFSVPAAGLAAAVAAQRALAKEDFSAVESLRVRMSIHTGAVESRDNDYFGRAINQAARLLSIVHGGQILVSGTTATMIGRELPPGASLKDLGRHHLKDCEDFERVFQIEAKDLPSGFPPLTAKILPPTNVTRGITSFVGRDAELAELDGALRRTRLVTLLGNGGAGKTRLATEAAAAAMPLYPDGVWFVDFSGLEDTGLVAEKIATVIGVRPQPDQTAATSVATALKEKSVLLIFDNCEHLLAAIAELADHILGLCTSTSILATGRQALGIGGEQIIQVSNLALAAGARIDAAHALAAPAVQLFVDRARSVTSFQLTDANAGSVAEICRRLDGIPLAIELAVHQLRVVRPEKLAAMLRESFAVRSTARSTPDRHRTLAATLDWSYRLLDDGERLLLQRLSVFSSGCTAAAATAVCGWGALDPETVGGHLADLVDKSLVVADLSVPETRFRLLETTRRYALAKLNEHGDEDRVRHQLAGNELEALSEATRAWPTLASEIWIERFGPELDDLRACLEWGFGPRGDLRLAVELVSLSLRVWDEHGLLPERQKWFDRALSVAPPKLPPIILARLYLGASSLRAAADPPAFGIADKAIQLLRDLPAGLDLGEAIAKAGSSLLTPGSVALAAPYLAEAHEILGRFGPTKPLASCLRSLCAMRFFEGNFPAARRLAMEAELVSRKIGDANGIATNRVNIADIDFASGATRVAIEAAQGILRERTAGPRLLALCQANLTSYLICAGETDEAEDSAVKALSAARALLWPGAIARSLCHLALIRALRNEHTGAAQIIGFIETRNPHWHDTREPIEGIINGRLMGLLGQLPPEKLAMLREVGSGCTEDEACTLAVGSPAVVRTLNPQRLASAPHGAVP